MTFPSPYVRNKQINEDLTLKIYSKKCFYKNAWDEETIEARGTIVDSTGKIITRPFRKVFNFGEGGRKPFDRDDWVIACEKVNGFMVAVSLYKDDLLITCKGSWEGTPIEIAKELLEPHRAAILTWFSQNPGKTLIYEICDPVRDPHPVVEAHGTYLLGIRDNESGQLLNPTLLPRHLSTFVPRAVVARFGDIMQAKKTTRKEGWLCYDTEDYNKAIKIKGNYYLTVKFFARMSLHKLAWMFEDKESFKQEHDEEYYDLVEWLCANYSYDAWLAIPEQERYALVGNFLLEKDNE